MKPFPEPSDQAHAIDPEFKMTNQEHAAGETNHPRAPLLLLQRSFQRSNSSMHDELRRFQISLKWIALDHSTFTGKIVSYTAFIMLAVFVPILSCLTVHVPASSSADDPISLNKLVQLPESGLAAIGFFTLCRFFRRYGLRQLLFLDGLQNDSSYVRNGYTNELEKSFRHLACILLPSFFVEFAHKIIFFSTVTISMPYVRQGGPLNSVMFVTVLSSWLYRTGVFLLVCALFRLTCELQLLRFEGFRRILEENGSNTAELFEEHLRIRKQLSATSHRYRWFIIVSYVTITVSQLGALLLVLASKSEKSFFNSGDLVVCSAVELSGFFLCLVGAARITHRAQGVVSIATRWHMVLTTASTSPNQFNHSQGSLSRAGDGSDSDSSDTFIKVSSSQDPYSFHTRQALVTYLRHNNGGITLFGFALDRGLLHTLFAFEFSLVLWILSKVVVLA